jgi:hypothetical protein
MSPGGVPERPKGSDCKSDVEDFGGSNPPPSTIHNMPEKSRFVRRRRLLTVVTAKMTLRDSTQEDFVRFRHKLKEID